jgi:hypothetical protein
LSECGISDPLQIYSGWLDEHDHDMTWYAVLATNFFDRHNAVLVCDGTKGKFNLHAEKHKAASSSFIPDFVRPLIVKNCLRFSTFQHCSSSRVELITRIHLGDVALTNDMLKDYKVGKAYEVGGYRRDIS